MKLTTKVVAASAIALGAGAVAFTSASAGAGNADELLTSDSTDTELQSYNEMDNEYRAALASPTLEMPPEWKFPGPDEAVTIEEYSSQAEGNGGSGGVAFEAGYGEVQAADIWRCAWEVELLNLTIDGDAAGAEDAAEQLLGFYDLPAVQEHVEDPEHLWYSEVVAPVLHGGDTGPLAEDIALNCDSRLASQVEDR